MSTFELAMVSFSFGFSFANLCASIYWYRQFKRAQNAAESLFFLASEGATSYDNGVWHQGVCEGEVMAAGVLEETRQTIMSLPGRGEYFKEMYQGELPF